MTGVPGGTPGVTFLVRAEMDTSYIYVEGMTMEALDVLRSRRNDGDLWAWAEVTVTAVLEEKGLERFFGYSLRCGCSYANEEEFLATDMFLHMKMEAMEDLRVALGLCVETGKKAERVLLSLQGD